MSCLNDFFTNIGPGWLNASTVVGALAGILLSVFAIWLTIRLSNQSNAISEAIKEHTIATGEQTAAIHKHAKILRLDNLRNLYELSKSKDTHAYWHFRWRFETYDRLSVSVLKKPGPEQEPLGACGLQVLGFSNRADHIGFENLQSEFYTAKVVSVQAAEGETFPFIVGDVVACFDQNLSDQMISKGTDPYTMLPKFPFIIGGLGNNQTRTGMTEAEAANSFARIKDF